MKRTSVFLVLSVLKNADLFVLVFGNTTNTEVTGHAVPNRGIGQMKVWWKKKG